jgi:hypothetical protein
VKTTKAYLAGLGTTAILIVSALLTLIFGTAVVAFDSGPEQVGAPSTLERVVVEREQSQRHAAERRRRR